MKFPMEVLAASNRLSDTQWPQQFGDTFVFHIKIIVVYLRLTKLALMIAPPAPTAETSTTGTQIAPTHTPPPMAQATGAPGGA